MYEEEEKRSFPLRDFLIKLILIIIFVVLLVWLLPIPDLTGLNSRIFNANVGEMKDAAISYFTTDRLPQKEGDSVTLTLQQMLDMKLLLPFKDKNGKTCDTQKSYVTLTKKENEYEMKVNLKCSEEEDYIIVHLGCYSYCESAICEKEEEKKVINNGGSTKKPTSTNEGAPSCTLEVSSGKKGENNWYIGDVVIKFKTKKTTSSGATITSYGLGTSKNYDKDNSYTVTKDGTTKVYGYVKDSKGKTAVCSITVKKDTKAPSCSLSVLSGTKNSDGKYITDVKVGFNKKTDSTSGILYYGVTDSSKVIYNSKTSYTVTKNGITKVYGYVKDNAGHKSVCDLTVEKVKVEEDKYSNPSCSLQVKSGTKGANNWYTSNVDVSFESKKTTNGATITSYGLGTSQNYNKNNSYTVKQDGTNTIYGYVKDSKGNTAVCSIVVKKDSTKPNCSLAVQKGTYKDSYYTSDVVVGFNSKNDATSGMNSFGIGKSTTYTNNSTYTITNVGNHTIYGYVKDNAGNTNICSINVVRKDITYEYEYVKTWDDKYSDWSNWTTATYDPSNPPKFGTTTTKVTEDLGSEKVLDKYKYSLGDPIYGNVTKEEESTRIFVKTCSSYKYYRISTNTTRTYAIKVADNDGWTYKETKTYVNKPEDTLSIKYVYAGEDWSCGDCTSTPKKLYKVYTRNVSVVTAEDTITNSNGVKVTCNSYETKPIVVVTTYNTIVGYNKVRTPVYKTIYKYRYKTRTLVQKAGSSTKWSAVLNDTTLINQGYKMTGNKRVKG